jgi:ABC-type polysaccharide/polyol phosphate transport system ATPase subunit
MTDDALVAAVEASGHSFGPPPVAAKTATSAALKKAGKKATPSSGRPAAPSPAPTVSGVKIVLKNVSIDIEQSAKVALLGKNGSGKR